MINNQPLLYLMTAGLLLSGTGLTLAQPTANRAVSDDGAIAQVSFKPPPYDRKPDRTAGAGSRQDGQCPQDAIALTETLSMMALVPNTNAGLTLAERPTFLIYLPKTSAKQVVLSLRKEGIDHHSQTFFAITETPGIISLKLANDLPPLEVGKNYQWAVVLVCGEKPGPNDPAIASWVRRVALSELLSDQKSTLEQAVWYGEQGIWYDTLMALAQARQAQPETRTLAGIWTDLLKSVGLEAIATEPLQF